MVRGNHSLDHQSFRQDIHTHKKTKFSKVALSLFGSAFSGMSIGRIWQRYIIHPYNFLICFKFVNPAPSRSDHYEFSHIVALITAEIPDVLLLLEKIYAFSSQSPRACWIHFKIFLLGKEGVKWAEQRWYTTEHAKLDGKKFTRPEPYV